jgi:hypothetical protein
MQLHRLESGRVPGPGRTVRPLQRPQGEQIELLAPGGVPVAVVNTRPVRPGRLPLGRLIHPPLPERPDGHLRQLQRAAGPRGLGVSAGPIRAQHRDPRGSPSRSTSCSQPIARASSGRTPAIRLTTTQACISAAGRRGSFNLPAAAVPVVPAVSARRGLVVERDAAMAAGHAFPVREHAPVVPGCGYRTSD